MRSEVITSGDWNIDDIASLRHFCHTTTPPLIHPDYFDQQGTWYRLVSVENRAVTIKASPNGHIHWSCTEALDNRNVHDTLERLFLSLPLPEEAISHLPMALQVRFRALAPLVHVGSLSLGEALIKAIIRQVITANHAKKLIDAFVRSYGEQRTYNGMTYYNFPLLEKIIEIPLEELKACGLGFKANVVRHVALSILENALEEKVRQVTREEALHVLQSIKGIGRWSAHVAICDLFGQWQYYPFEDLAVRTWTRKLWPEKQWPTDERAFSALWQELHGASTGLITFYLLSCALTQPSQPQQWRQEVLI